MTASAITKKLPFAAAAVAAAVAFAAPAAAQTAEEYVASSRQACEASYEGTETYSREAHNTACGCVITEIEKIDPTMAQYAFLSAAMNLDDAGAQAAIGQMSSQEEATEVLTALMDSITVCRPDQ